MSWRLLLILMVLFVVIHGDRLGNNGFQRLTAPYAENVKNSAAQRIAVLEGIAKKNSGFEDNSDGTTAQVKTFQPCHPNTALERYESVADCGFSGERSETLDGNLRSALSSSLELTKTFDLSDPDGAFQSNDDAPYDLDLTSSAISGFNVADFYNDLLEDAKRVDVKRGVAMSTIGCDCKIKNDLLDLGHRHFPRYLLNAVCHSENSQPRCWRGTCKPLEYKVKVLTVRTVKDYATRDPAMAWLPDDLRPLWKFKTVTVAAGCFCANG